MKKQILHIVLKYFDNQAIFGVVEAFSVLKKSARFCYNFTKILGRRHQKLQKNLYLKVKIRKNTFIKSFK